MLYKGFRPQEVNQSIMDIPTQSSYFFWKKSKDGKVSTDLNQILNTDLLRRGNWYIRVEGIVLPPQNKLTEPELLWLVSPNCTVTNRNIAPKEIPLAVFKGPFEPKATAKSPWFCCFFNNSGDSRSWPRVATSKETPVVIRLESLTGGPGQFDHKYEFSLGFTLLIT